MTVFDDFKQILALSIAERREDKQLDLSQFGKGL
jgi:hypothetical protein